VLRSPAPLDERSLTQERIGRVAGAVFALAADLMSVGFDTSEVRREKAGSLLHFVPARHVLEGLHLGWTDIAQTVSVATREIPQWS
jgi:hypothetical protein